MQQIDDGKQDWLYGKKKPNVPTQNWLGYGNTPFQQPQAQTPRYVNPYMMTPPWWQNPYQAFGPANPGTPYSNGPAGLKRPYGMDAGYPWKPTPYTGYASQNPIATVQATAARSYEKAAPAQASKYPGSMNLWDQMQAENQSRVFQTERDPYWKIPDVQGAPISTQQAGGGGYGGYGYGSGGGYGYGYGYPSYGYKPGGNYATGVAVKKFWMDLLSWNNPQERVNG